MGTNIGVTKKREFIDQLTDHQLLKKDPAPKRQLYTITGH